MFGKGTCRGLPRRLMDEKARGDLIRTVMRSVSAVHEIARRKNAIDDYGDGDQSERQKD